MARERKPAGRSVGYQSRRMNTRLPAQRFLIVCEGEETERLYFLAFRAPGLVVKVHGLGKDPLTVVAEAERLRHQNEYEQVWCVFDRDDVTPDRFNKALAMAAGFKIRVAYSNPAFELWFLLHFHYCHTPITRADYINQLNQCLPKRYDKRDGTMYTLLQKKQVMALTHAAKLLNEYDPAQPAYDDPATTVHLLVQALNQVGRIHHG